MAFWVIFATRMIYVCAAQAGMWELQISIDDSSCKQFGVSVFLLLILWEILPTSMVLWCFRSIPSTNAAGCGFWKWRDYQGDYSSDHRYLPQPHPRWRNSIRNRNDSSDSALTINQSPILYSPPRLLGDLQSGNEENIPIRTSAHHSRKKSNVSHDGLQEVMKVTDVSSRYPDDLSFVMD